MQRSWLAWFGVGASLALGSAVYLLGRDWSTVYLLHWVAGGQRVGPLLELGRWGGSAPSFAHAYGFSLLTAFLLGGGSGAAARACGLWAVLDGLFELGQQPEWAAALPPLPPFLARVPVVENFNAYFQQGHFDVLDLVAIVAGCGAAWLTAVFISRGAGRRRDSG